MYTLYHYVDGVKRIFSLFFIPHNGNTINALKVIISMMFEITSNRYHHMISGRKITQIPNIIGSKNSFQKQVLGVNRIYSSIRNMKNSEWKIGLVFIIQYIQLLLLLLVESSLPTRTFTFFAGIDVLIFLLMVVLRYSPKFQTILYHIINHVKKLFGIFLQCIVTPQIQRLPGRPRALASPSDPFRVPNALQIYLECKIPSY